MSPSIMQRKLWRDMPRNALKIFLHSRNSHPRRAWDTAYRENEACPHPLLRQRHVCGCGADEAFSCAELLASLSRRLEQIELRYKLWMFPWNRGSSPPIGICLHPWPESCLFSTSTFPIHRHAFLTICFHNLGHSRPHCFRAISPI